MEREASRINNAFYEDLGEAWYEDNAHPIALLRAENAVRNPWILSQIQNKLGRGLHDILDIGCGAGFLSNVLAQHGHRVTGVDLSAKSLEIAMQKDLTKTVRYLQCDAFALPYPEKSFDVICAMDFLEHIEKPEAIVQSVARLLRPGGLFFFHTFNRNWLSWLMVIKGVEWCVPNTPPNIHVYRLFIKPQELKGWCEKSGLHVDQLQGLAPQLASKAFWKSLMTRKVDSEFSFCFTQSLQVGYVGIAIREN